MSKIEYNELPDSSVPFTDNYTGPYRSDGQWQASVPFGKSNPQSKLDALSRLHDTAYATYSDYGHRTAADSLYKKESDKLVGLFPKLAGHAVVYGNKIAQAASTDPFTNALNLYDYMLNEKKYKKEIQALYATDPRTKTIPGGLGAFPVLSAPKAPKVGPQATSVWLPSTKTGSLKSQLQPVTRSSRYIPGDEFRMNFFKKKKKRARVFAQS